MALLIFAWLTRVLRLAILRLTPFLALLLTSSRIGAFLSELLMMTSFLLFIRCPLFGFALPLLEE